MLSKYATALHRYKNFGFLAVGAAILIVLVAFGRQYASPPPQVLDPYAYASAEAAPSDAALQLASIAQGAEPRVYELRTQVKNEEWTLAQLEVLEIGQRDNLIIGWRSNVAEPVLRSDILVEEELALVKALNTYLPANAPVFAMPALSRRLEHLTSAILPIASGDEALSLRMPDMSADTATTVLRLERRWLGETASDGPDEFGGLLQALTADGESGVASLQSMAEGEEAYVVLHLRDAFDVAVTAPEKISVGLRDFPGSGHVHDTTRLVKSWIADENLAAYAIQHISSDVIRAYYLAESKDTSTLLGQLLPFNTSPIGLVPNTKLVFQTGGYWVYKIVAASN